ncbi:unnamed protein product [Adineta steineri]|uniref:NAD(P)(+)--arginine ADP-ribosyltransferase n=1 Tax=Adineta steineri TaxID=433720 RepID=A0A818J8L4_9BILA|nr:unnamed protein product [Adineta steineri]CAF3535401.1 unnamed protein product [Adineta steineri]
MAGPKSLEVDFRDPAHDLCIVPSNTPTHVRTVEGTYKEILDYPHKYNLSTPQQSIRQAEARFSYDFGLANLYDSEHHLSTGEVSIKVYTYNSCIYVKLNEALRKGDKDVLLLFAPYIYSLLGGLKEVKRHYHGTVYRGMGLESKPISTYRKGLLFYWPGFTSCTKDIQIATKWTGCTAVFIINISQRFAHACSSIEDISKFQSEKEVLLQPYTCFRVLNDPSQYECSDKTVTKIELIIESTACNLFGVWTCDDSEHNVQDAGTYFISQYGQKVFWFGRQHKSHWNFANIGYGSINNDHELIIQWGDLPIAHDRYSGELKLKISSDYQSMIKTYDSNKIFYGTNFRRISNEYLDTFQIDKNIKWAKVDDMSGCWEGDDGSTYIIGTCKNQIYWLAVDKNNSWSHVGVGTYNADIIKINWGDLIIGQDRLHGEIECKIISNNKISIVKRIHGQFLTKELTKKS